jgi:hypothetical protein
MFQHDVGRLSGFCIPQSSRAVCAAGQHTLAVRTERDTMNNITMCHGNSDGQTTVGIPEARRFVVASCDHGHTVRTNG